MEYTFLFTLFCAFLCQSSVLCSTTETTNSTAPTPAAPGKPGPNDLVVVDYIIIGVTSGMFVAIIIGTTIVIYRARKKSKENMEESYDQMMKKPVKGEMPDDYWGNPSFDSDDHSVRKRAASDNSWQEVDVTKLKADPYLGALGSTTASLQAHVVHRKLDADCEASTML